MYVKFHPFNQNQNHDNHLTTLQDLTTYNENTDTNAQGKFNENTNLGSEAPRLVKLFRYSLGLIKLSPSFFIVGN